MASLRLLLVLAIVVILTTAGSIQAEEAVSPAAITVVYVSAKNCPPCWHFDKAYRPAWEASPERQQVNFRVIKTYQWQDAKYKPAWPDDLEGVRKAIRHRGAPQFVIIADDKIKMNLLIRESHPAMRRR